MSSSHGHHHHHPHHQQPNVEEEDQVSCRQRRTFSCASQGSTPRWTASRRNDTESFSILQLSILEKIAPQKVNNSEICTKKSSHLENIFAHPTVGFHMARQLATLCAAVRAHLTLVRLLSWKQDIFRAALSLLENAPEMCKYPDIADMDVVGVTRIWRWFARFWLENVFLELFYSTCVTSSVHSQVGAVLEDLIITC